MVSWCFRGGCAVLGIVSNEKQVVCGIIVYRLLGAYVLLQCYAMLLQSPFHDGETIVG